jgi:hypothetical protein
MIGGTRRPVKPNDAGFVSNFARQEPARHAAEAAIRQKKPGGNFASRKVEHWSEIDREQHGRCYLPVF